MLQKRSPTFIKITIFGLVLLAIVIAGMLMGMGRPTSQNHVDLEGPRFADDFANDVVQFDGVVTAVSYNIKFSQNINNAVNDLQEFESLANTDILMLQEMDEAGVAQIAAALNLNAIYYPGAIHAESGRNFGNAILSPWPIVADSKLILPHKSIASNMQRIATKAIVQVGDQNVLTYSVHTETILSLPWQRQNQFTAIVEDIDPAAKYVIVGGDFNTVSTAQVEKLEDTFAEAKMVRATAGSGYTAERFNVEAVADHIFTRGFDIINGGEIPQATASDHFPVWAELRFKKP